MLITLATLLAAIAATADALRPGAFVDQRNIRHGRPIPDEGYCDQPYTVVAPDGSWICLLTTGPGKEGDRGQHVVSTRSLDQGRTWSKLTPIEPSDGPEASWVIPLLTPYGRLYAFYDFNGDEIRLKDGKPIRADMLGWYVYRYSDDLGATWSKERFRLPIRVTQCDRTNDWKGTTQIFWGVCEPQTQGSSAAFTFTKLGKYMLDNGEGWMFRSDNILSEHDPKKIRWTMTPEGEHGIRRADFGSVQEEHNIVWTGPESLYCVYRTTMGFPCQSTSVDGGRHWTKPEPLRYSPGGPIVRHPRACPRLWKISGERYLLWFHNNGGKDFRNRNPAWIAGGTFRDGVMRWSQPEILLYDPDPNVRMSYPDLIEQDGRYWITETQKTVARVHEVDPDLINGLFPQATTAPPVEGFILDASRDALRRGPAPLPASLDLSRMRGVTIDLWLAIVDPAAAGVLVSTEDSGGRGMRLETTTNGGIRWHGADGKNRASVESQPGIWKEPGRRHLSIIVDAGPKVVLFVVDGQLLDGGEHSRQGWRRCTPDLRDISGARRLSAPVNAAAIVERARVFSRPLRTAEAAQNFRAGS